jgi:uncharacterized protein
VKLPDANVLLYSTNSDSRHHESSRNWLDAALSGDDTVAFSWIPLLAFLRLATKAGLFPRPLSHVEALDQVDEWLAAPPAVVIEPTVDHPRIVRQLLNGVGVAGDLVMDAHLAALSIEHKCVVVSYDNDFDRFEGVRRETPST